MMNYSELIALRGRLIAAQANRHTIGAAEAYVRALEAEVALTDFNSRRASVRHLLALVDAALEARKNLPNTINRERDFTHANATREAPKTLVVPPPLRGRTEVVEMIDEAAFPSPAVDSTPQPVEAEVKPERKAPPKGRRVAHGRGRKDATSSE